MHCYELCPDFFFCLKVQMAERASEVTELKRNLAQALRDKEQLQEVKQHQVHTSHILFVFFTVEMIQILIMNVSSFFFFKNILV